MNKNYAFRAGAYAGSLESLLFEHEIYKLLDGNPEKIERFENLIREKLQFAEEISVEREEKEAKQ